MARPFKEGLDYFPLDVDFLEDKKVKLIKAEFGSKGILVLISLLILVYKSNGYFYKWDKDDCLLMSDGVGCGCGPEFIQEVLQGCIRRSIFDEGVFDMFNVITSAGIQKRFLNAISERKNTNIIKDYLLVDLSDEKVCPPGTFKKLTIISINPPINSVNPPINSDKLPNNTERKVKESKEEILSAYADDSLEMKICDYLISRIVSNNPKAKVPQGIKKQKWAEQIDKLSRIDKRTKQEIAAVIDFSQSDSFWKTNILSAGKLREQFDKLWLQCRAKAEKASKQKSSQPTIIQTDQIPDYFLQANGYKEE